MGWKDLSNSEKVVRIISALLAVVGIIVLVLIKIANPEFKLGLVVIIIIGIILFFTAIIIGFHIYQKRKAVSKVVGEKTDDKMPRAITLEQAREIVHTLLRNPVYAEYINQCLGETSELMGDTMKSNIYTYKGKGVYEKDMYYVVINRNYPNELVDILINPTDAQLSRAKRLCSKSPEKEPDMEETVIENPLLGTRSVTRKIQKHESKEEKAKKEDL